MILTPPHRLCRHGFTLMELMVVLVLIGLMTAMILPEMRGTYEEAVLSSTARKLADVCGIAYSRAVAVQQPHRLRLDRAAHRYSVERRISRTGGEDNYAPAQDIPGGEGKLDSRISIDFGNPNEGAVGWVASDPSPPAQQVQYSDEGIVFYPDGTADARKIQLQDREGFRLAILINPTTARVQIKELESQ